MARPLYGDGGGSIAISFLMIGSEAPTLPHSWFPACIGESEILSTSIGLFLFLVPKKDRAKICRFHIIKSYFRLSFP